MESLTRVSRRKFASSGLGLFAALRLPAEVLAQAPAPPRLKAVPPISAEEEKANVAVVNRWCGAWEKYDMTTIADTLADNITFRLTQDQQWVVGKKATMEAFEGLVQHGKRTIRVVTLKTVVCGPMVVNERDDYIGAFGNQPASVVHVHAGMFFLINRKIVEFTDFIVRA